jgi:predicted ABC-type ATPase
MSARPNVLVIAGPNGAGKSTIAPEFLRDELGIDDFVNADVIAKGLSWFAPEEVAFQAGRIMLKRLGALARRRANFAFETTLASRSFAPWIARLVAARYEFRLVFVTLPSPDLSVARVASRVAEGGHHVPEDTIRRRFATGHANFFALYRPLAAAWRMYDNARRTRRMVASGSGDQTVAVADKSIWSRLKREYTR